MFKRIMLALTFVGALGVTGFVIPPDSAEARWDRRSYYRSYYGPPRTYYRSYYRAPVYSRYYYGGPGYYSYGSPYYSGYYGGYYPRSGISFSFGF